MISKISKEGFGSIKMIYHNILFAYSDYEYLSVHKLDITKAAFIDQNQTFFNRIKYYLYHFTIIELNKVFNNPETYSLNKYINYELKKSSIDDSLKNDLSGLKNKINSKSTIIVLNNINTIRNNVSAHLDSERQKLNSVKILVLEIKHLLDLLNEFVRIFSKIIEEKEYVNPITKEILGYKLHDQFAKSVKKK